MASTPDRPLFRRRHGKAFTSLLLATFLALGLMAKYRPLERQQELRVAICGRNMLQSGDWIVPVFQDQVRLRKPPLLYWLTGASMGVFGPRNVEWVARAPGVAISLGLVAFVCLAGRRLVGPRAAVLAGAVTAFSPIFLGYGCLAETDGAQALCVSGAIYWGWRALSAGRGAPGRWRHWLLAGLCSGLGVLAKSPASVVFPALVLGAYALSLRARLRPQAWGALAAGLLLTAAIALPWYLAVWNWQSTNAAAGEAIANEAKALLAETRHPGPPWYYLYTAPVRLLPWSLALPWALAAAWRARRRPGVRLLLCWLGVTLVVLSALPSKQAHYAWLLLPPLALVLSFAPFARRLRLSPRASLWARRTVLAASGCGAAAFLFLSPTTQYVGPSAQLRKVADRVAASPLIHVAGANSAIFDFYLGRHVHNAESAEAAWRRARPGEAVVLWWTRDRSELPDERFALTGWSARGLSITYAIKPPKERQ